MIKPRYQETTPESIPEVKSSDGKVTIKVIAGEALGKVIFIWVRSIYVPKMY